MKGWKYEGYRHSLAAKGIKTTMRSKHPGLVKDFPGENPRITKNYARFRQQDPSKFDKFRVKGHVVLGHNKKTGDWQAQSIMIPLNKKTSLAVVGFDPRQREMIKRILAKNPRLKSKIETLAEDIRGGTYDFSHGEPENVEADVAGLTVAYSPRVLDKFRQAEETLAQPLTKVDLEMEEETNTVLAQIPGDTLREKQMNLNRMRPNTIYLSRDPESSRHLRALVSEYGFEEGMERFWTYVLEHEVTHLAQARKLGYDEFGRLSDLTLQQKIPEIVESHEYISPPSTVDYIINPVEFHPNVELRDSYPGKKEIGNWALEKSPTLKRIRQEYFESLQKGPLIKGQKLWKGRQPRKVSEEEAYKNLARLEQMNYIQ